MPKPKPRPPSLPQLYAQLERATSIVRAWPAATDPNASTTAFDRAVDKCCRIAEKIAVAPARNVAEILIKLRVAAWQAANGPAAKSLADLDHWYPGEFEKGAEWHTLASVRDDLVRIFGELQEPWSVGKFQKPLTRRRPPEQRVGH
jgi:hypothetical protein